MLEQIAYQLPKSSEERQVVYQVGDLESLSSVALYAKDKIKIGQDLEKDGTMYKFYTDISLINFGDTELGIQEKGEKHKDYAKKMKEGGGISLGGGLSMPSSSCSGGY